MENNSNKSITEIIKSNTFGFYLSLVAVTVQAVHSQYVLTQLSSLGEYAVYHSTIVAILISGAILYFTLRKRVNIAIGAAAFEMYMNIAYYIRFITEEKESNWNYLWIAIPSSIALPVILALFSHELIEEIEESTEIDTTVQNTQEIQINKLKEEINKLKEQNIKTRKQIIQTYIRSKQLIPKTKPINGDFNITVDNKTYKANLKQLN